MSPPQAPKFFCQVVQMPHLDNVHQNLIYVTFRTDVQMPHLDMLHQNLIYETFGTDVQMPHLDNLHQNLIYVTFGTNVRLIINPLRLINPFRLKDPKVGRSSTSIVQYSFLFLLGVSGPSFAPIILPGGLLFLRKDPSSLLYKQFAFTTMEYFTAQILDLLILGGLLI